MDDGPVRSGDVSSSPVATGRTVTVRVPAKVNLQLVVGPLRDDGYHDLVNVFHAVSLTDEITITHLPSRTDHVGIEVEGGSIGGVPTDGDNLAARAVRLLARRLGIDPAVSVRIRKSIPVAGGMAGGSADAAAALVACNELWQAGLSVTDLMEPAAELGSDVPFALLGGTAVGFGRGEKLGPVPAQGRFHWAFAAARGGLSTPAVYAECDRLRAAGSQRPPGELKAGAGVLHALATGDVKALGTALSNDLQPAALSLRPALRRTLDVGIGAGAAGAVVSGSGPTCAFLAESAAQADDLREALMTAGVARSVTTAYGPVAGATVV